MAGTPRLGFDSTSLKRLQKEPNLYCDCLKYANRNYWPKKVCADDDDIFGFLLQGTKVDRSESQLFKNVPLCEHDNSNEQEELNKEVIIKSSYIRDSQHDHELADFKSEC